MIVSCAFVCRPSGKAARSLPICNIMEQQNALPGRRSLKEKASASRFGDLDTYIEKTDPVCGCGEYIFADRKILVTFLPFKGKISAQKINMRIKRQDDNKMKLEGES